MGHHYTPQQHLRGFCVPAQPECVWMYDKKNARFSNEPVSIRQVAQSSGFYSEEQERQLNNLIEIPGNRAVEKLLNGQPLAGEERLALAAYMATMISRVPRNRERGKNIAPVALTAVADELRTEILTAAERQRVPEPTVERFLSELDAVEKKFRAEPPPNVAEQMRSPWPVPAVLLAIAQMPWRIVQAKEGAFFVTSDNPACFHECYGFVKRESEFTFPLASRLALFGCWQRQQGAYETHFDQRVLREINRRTIKEATRFIFSPRRAEWIDTVAQKREPHISLIRWKKPR
jgi:hypothetical protein